MNEEKNWVGKIHDQLKEDIADWQDQVDELTLDVDVKDDVYSLLDEARTLLLRCSQSL